MNRICWVKQRIFDSLSPVVPTGEGTPGWLFRILGNAKSKAVEMATKGSSVFLPLNQTDIAAMKMLRLRNHITVHSCQFWRDFRDGLPSGALTEEDDSRKKSCGCISLNVKGDCHIESVVGSVDGAIELRWINETLDGAIHKHRDWYAGAVAAECRYLDKRLVRVERVTVGISTLHRILGKWAPLQNQDTLTPYRIQTNRLKQQPSIRWQVERFKYCIRLDLNLINGLIILVFPPTTVMKWRRTHYTYWMRSHCWMPRR